MAGLVPGLCCLGFAGAMWSKHQLAAPIHLFDPIASRCLGDFLYLTYHSNLFGVLYFAAVVANGLLGAGFDASLWRLFPLAFAFGTFLTAAYYALDHFNVENYRRKEIHRRAYPHVHLCGHLEHAHALPLVVLYALCGAQHKCSSRELQSSRVCARANHPTATWRPHTPQPSRRRASRRRRRRTRTTSSAVTWHGTSASCT